MGGNRAYWIIVASSSSFEDWSIAAILALGIYSLLFVLLPRVRDTGMSGWWVLLSLFPVVNGLFYLFLIFRAPEYHFEGSSNAAEQA